MVGGEGIAASTDRDVIAYGRMYSCDRVRDVLYNPVVSANHCVTRVSRNYVFLR